MATQISDLTVEEAVGEATIGFEARGTLVHSVTPDDAEGDPLGPCTFVLQARDGSASFTHYTRLDRTVAWARSYQPTKLPT